MSNWYESRRLTLNTLSVLSLGAGLAGCSKDNDKNHNVSEQSQASAPALTKTALATEKKSAPARVMPKLQNLSINPAEQTPAAIKLGHALFFDKRLSADGSVSCYSCHQNEDGNGGATPTAVGAKGKKLSRHSPVIWNVGYLPELYWNGRASSLEAQAKGAWGGGNMGVGKANLQAKTDEIAAIPGYKALFTSAYPEQKPSPELVAKALSAYERTLTCDDTDYDRYVAGDKKALSNEQLEGYDVFMGKAMCSACHAPPLFTNAMMTQGAFFNVGIGTKGVSEEKLDIGRMKISKKPEDKAAFKTPSLRNVAKSAPYFHNGSVDKLTDAVHLMASGGIANPNLSPLIADRNLSQKEKGQLLAFLEGLNCRGTLKEPQLP